MPNDCLLVPIYFSSEASPSSLVDGHRGSCSSSNAKSWPPRGWSVFDLGNLGKKVPPTLHAASKRNMKCLWRFIWRLGLKEVPRTILKINEGVLRFLAHSVYGGYSSRMFVPFIFCAQLRVSNTITYCSSRSSRKFAEIFPNKSWIFPRNHTPSWRPTLL